MPCPPCAKSVGNLPESQAASSFALHRPHLLAVAYRFTGSVADAEYLVQDAYLRWRDVESTTVRDIRAYLTRIVARLSLDHLKSARARRETYVGTWLPEPLVSLAGLTTPDVTAVSDDISYALMLALERLSPLERAAYVLHTLLGHSFEEVAETLKRTPAACRQLVSRAGRHVAGDTSRFAVDRAAGEQVAEAFLEALNSGDDDRLTELLARDAVLHSDSGGKVRSARRDVIGRARVSRLFSSLRRRLGPPLSGRVVPINGHPGLLMQDVRGITQTIAFDLRDGRIQKLYLVRNPEKLHHLGAAPAQV